MRVAGVRLQAPVARLLSETLEGEGFAATGAKIADAIERQITTEASLLVADYQAILEALNRNCPASLYGLRRSLLEDQRYIRRVAGA